MRIKNVEVFPHSYDFIKLGLYDEISECLDGLDFVERELIMRRYGYEPYDVHSFREIAMIKGVPESTVRYMIKKILKRLSVKLLN